LEHQWPSLKICCTPPNASPRLLYHPTHMMQTNVNIKNWHSISYCQHLWQWLTINTKRHMINIKTFTITFVTTWWWKKCKASPPFFPCIFTNDFLSCLVQILRLALVVVLMKENHHG
jgi:hypothetical protein